ncbi:MAG: hypothetical protein ACJAVI_004941 [Candidatus Azotimanducaceae bacterium]
MINSQENVFSVFVKAFGIFACFALTYFLLGTPQSIGSALFDAEFDFPKDSERLLQIFWRVDTGYSEQESIRINVAGGSKHKIRVILPDENGEVRLRVDVPPGKTIFHSISLYSPFYFANLNLNRVEIGARNSIEKIEVQDGKLQVYANQSDPYFELNIGSDHRKFSDLSRFLCALLVALCISCFYMVRKDRFKVALLASSLIFTMWVCWLSFPGWMSYDSFHALRGARFGVQDAEWPPMVSYIWSIVELIWPMPTTMQFSQVWLFYFCSALVVYKLTRNAVVAFLFLVTINFHPIFIGTALVIWKDVLTSSIACLVILLSLTFNFDKYRLLKIGLVLVLIFVGVLTRHNAIFAFVFLLAILFSRGKVFDSSLVGSVKTFFLAVIVALIMLGLKGLAESYSWQSGEKLGGRSQSLFLKTPMIFDLAGASICLNENLMRTTGQDISLEEIRSSYHPQHVTLSARLLRNGYSEKLFSVWLKNLIEHPVCMNKRRWDYMVYILGFHEGQPFLLSHPGILENEFGYQANPERSKAFVQWFSNVSELTVFKPGFLLVFSLFLVLFNSRRFNPFGIEGLLMWSGLSYWGSYLLFGNAADTRLLHYSNTVFAISIFVEMNRLRFRGGRQ